MSLVRSSSNDCWEICDRNKSSSEGTLSVHMENCSDVSLLPTSTEFYKVVDTAVLVFLCVDGVLTLAVLVLFAVDVIFVVRTYKHINIAIKSIWVISIYPVFAVSALLAVCVPRASYICDFVSTCYLSICLFQFSSLLLFYFGHLNNLLAKIKDTGFSLRARPCCCCCLCCPVLPATRRSLRIVRLMILQTATLQPIIQFISAVMWADEKFVRSGIDPDNSYVYLNTVKIISTMVAIYGLQTLHTTLKPHLTEHNTAPKQVALLMVQLFFALQGAIMEIPARYNKPPCRSGLTSHLQMGIWHHLVLVVEMFLLSVLARIFYHRPLKMDPTLQAKAHFLSDFFVDIESYEAGGGGNNGQIQLEAVTSDSSKADDVGVSPSNASCTNNSTAVDASGKGATNLAFDGKVVGDINESGEGVKGGDSGETEPEHAVDVRL